MIHRSLTARLAHVLERWGLALAGAACGLYVAAYMARTSNEHLSSILALTVVMAIGALGFYLGIDVPPSQANSARQDASGDVTVEPDRVEVLSAFGTFVAALAALCAVYAILTDSMEGVPWPTIIPLGWVLGALMQIISGAIARLRP
jgi:amino acid permease